LQTRIIVKDTTNDGIAFLSHLELDHRIMHTFQLMATEEKPVLKIRMKTVQDYENCIKLSHNHTNCDNIQKHPFCLWIQLMLYSITSYEQRSEEAERMLSDCLGK
jgi:hypothetical protein